VIPVNLFFNLLLLLLISSMMVPNESTGARTLPARLKQIDLAAAPENG